MMNCYYRCGSSVCFEFVGHELDWDTTTTTTTTRLRSIHHNTNQFGFGFNSWSWLLVAKLARNETSRLSLVSSGLRWFALVRGLNGTLGTLGTQVKRHEFSSLVSLNRQMWNKLILPKAANFCNRHQRSTTTQIYIISENCVVVVVVVATI